MPTIPPGARFGVYEIISPLGAGGMGEVYRARDIKLKRDAAIKLLPPGLAGDRDRLSRFEREARAASSLNHPNIVTIYEIGDVRGVPFIAMELVDGMTLRQLLAAGAMPVRRLLELAAQAADGLAKAHNAGIVHRDLKPENLMVTQDGFVKILDFGLAKLTAHESGELQAKSTIFETEAGVVMGTTTYMSPEQASGREIDFRSDQFAFGSILYEMATGRRPFQAKTSAQTMAAIIQDEPESIVALNPKVPAPLRWVVERCLAKERERRYASTTDLARDLATLRDRLSEASTAAGISPSPSPRRRWRAAALAVGLLAAGAAGTWLSWRLTVRPQPANPHDLGAFRFTPFAVDPAFESSPAWSRDGKSLAYVRRIDGVNQIVVQGSDSPIGTQVTSLETGCGRPTWAPDGTRIYFTTYRSESGFSLFSVGVAGGAPELVLEPISQFTVSPDGRTIAFQAFVGSDRKQLWISSPPGAKARELVLSGAGAVRQYLSPKFSPDGSKIGIWIESESGRALAVFSYPDGALRWVGKAQAARGRLTISWLPDNRRVVVNGAGAASGQLWVVDTLDGVEWPLTVGPAVEYWDPAVSPDGERLAFVSGKEDRDLVELPIDGSPARSLLATPLLEAFPAWSPAGDQLAYVTDRSGAREIWLRSPKEGWERPLVTSREFEGRECCFDSLNFSPDGRWLAYQTTSKSGEFALWISSSAGGPPVALAGGKGLVDAPIWSPDGRSIAFGKYVSPSESFLVRAEVGSALEPQRIAEDTGALYPSWSPTGAWISHLAKDGLAIVSPDGKNRRLLLPDGYLNPFGWSRDGRTIYGLRVDPRRHTQFCALDIATSRLKVLGDLGPEAEYSGFSLSPDGKSFASSVVRTPADIWILEGWKATPGAAAESR